MREADEQAYGLVKKLDVPNGLGVFARSPGLLTALLARLAARSTRPSDDWGESATSPATADAAQFFLEAGGITEGVVSKIPGVPKCCDDDRSVVHDFGCVVPCSDGVCAADGVGTYAAGRLSRQQQQQVLHRRRLGNIVARQARYDRPRRLETMTLRDELEAKLRAIYVAAEDDVFGHIADEVIRQMEWASKIGFNSCCGRITDNDKNFPEEDALCLAPEDWKP